MIEFKFVSIFGYLIFKILFAHSKEISQRNESLYLFVKKNFSKDFTFREQTKIKDKIHKWVGSFAIRFLK